MLYNIYNIDERIYLPVTIVLTLIILVICSFHFYKKKKIALNTILSIWAICLSAIAFIAAFLRVDVYFTNDSFVGIMAGFMGACATILVGVQIYNSIDTRNSINKLNESFEEKINNLNTTYHARTSELQALNNKLKYDLSDLNKKLEQAKQERNKNDKRMQAYIERAHGISLSEIQPFTACKHLFYGLKLALENNDYETIEPILHDMNVISNKIKDKDPKEINKAHYDTLEEMSPDKLEEFKFYPLISYGYQLFFNNLKEAKKKIDASKKGQSNN